MDDHELIRAVESRLLNEKELIEFMQHGHMIYTPYVCGDDSKRLRFNAALTFQQILATKELSKLQKKE